MKTIPESDRVMLSLIFSDFSMCYSIFRGGNNLILQKKTLWKAHEIVSKSKTVFRVAAGNTWSKTWQTERL